MANQRMKREWMNVCDRLYVWWFLTSFLALLLVGELDGVWYFLDDYPLRNWQVDITHAINNGWKEDGRSCWFRFGLPFTHPATALPIWILIICLYPFLLGQFYLSDRENRNGSLSLPTCSFDRRFRMTWNLFPISQRTRLHDTYIRLIYIMFLVCK